MQLRDSIMFIIIIILQPTVKVSCPVTLSSMVELLATPSSQLGLVNHIRICMGSGFNEYVKYVRRHKNAVDWQNNFNGAHMK